ncbi:hypothetical protein Csa_011433 [Cucumis sativus]|uniref:Uncharacterized protein n=1 Tax=Cucumis sativus TaxID=3659 RepID=A0A0A0L4W5_CUCSA|nr:hypothetical protein Csa_011433 [Cucumis sativus]
MLRSMNQGATDLLLISLVCILITSTSDSSSILVLPVLPDWLILFLWNIFLPGIDISCRSLFAYDGQILK